MKASFLIVYMMASTLMGFAREETNKASLLSLQGIPIPDFKSYDHEDENVIISYRTITHPILITLNEKTLTYQRQDGKGFYHPSAAVVIKDNVIRFGGSKTKFISFVVETPLGAVTYHYNLENFVMTKVETQHQFPAGKDSGGRTAVTITQFLCGKVPQK